MKTKLLASKPKVLLSIIFFISCVSLHAQFSLLRPLHLEKYTTINGEKFVIHSNVLDQNKEIFVGLPKNFNDTTHYPMVLVLEGEVVFDTFAPLTRLMADAGEIPECLVVGIPFYNKHLEYAPRISTVPQSGNADKMLDFYRTELFPLLDSCYHCGNDKIIWAHSGLGGIFCTYLLLGSDNQFNGILSSSPNLKFMRDYIEKENAFADLAKKGNVFYYLTFGSNEGEDYMSGMYTEVKQFKEKLEKEAPDNLIWKYQLNENNDHFTNAVETFTDGLILYFGMMK